MLHIIYREEGNLNTGRKPVGQKAMRQLYDQFSKQIKTKAPNTAVSKLTDEEEQEAASIYIRAKYENKEEIRQAIAKYENQNSEVVTTTTTSFKRNNIVASLIKQYRGYKCQICGISILKSDGTYYVEAAHIMPHHQGGTTSLYNIIILCPNHHKEFDLGRKKVKYIDTSSVEIMLNGTVYQLNLI